MRNKTGIQELRALVSMAGWSQEWAFDGFDAAETVRLLQACKACDLEVLPDMLTLNERRYAAKTSKVSTGALKRLYKAEGLAMTGPDWEGRGK